MSEKERTNDALIENLKKQLKDKDFQLEQLKKPKAKRTKRKTKAVLEEERIEALPDRKVGLPADVSSKSLQKHQVEFVDNFINGFPKGAIAVHGVGSGKTLTAVISAETFLQKFPDSKVIVITPASLLAGFKEELYAYDPAIEKDKRYTFFTYDGYANAVKKGLKTADCQDALLIVDEAQNLRTTIRIKEETVLNDDGNLEARDVVKSGARVLSIIKNCSMKARKILLLSATPVVNNIGDLENLMAMINGHEPLDPKSGFFNQLINSPELMARYFGCRLSFFSHDKATRDKFFPQMEEMYVPIVMNAKTLEAYKSIESEKPSDEIRKQLHIKADTSKINAFFTGLRKAVNAIGGENSQKVNFILDWINGVRDETPNKKIGLTKKIIDSHTKQVVLFTHFKDTGSNLIIKRLKEEGIKFGIINGTVSKPNRAKIVKEYVAGNIQVILISKAGAEGLNLLKTGYIIIIEPSWNNTEQEQVKGRGVRFMSHTSLPKEKQNVLILDLFLIKPDEVDIFKKVIKEVQLSLNPSEFNKATEKEFNELQKKKTEVYKYIIENKDEPMLGNESFNAFWKNFWGKKTPLTLESLENYGAPQIKTTLTDPQTQRRAGRAVRKDTPRLFDSKLYKEALTKFNLKFIPPPTLAEFRRGGYNLSIEDVGQSSIDLRLFGISNLKQLQINNYLTELKKIDPVERCKSPKEFLDIMSLFKIEPDKKVPALSAWEKNFYSKTVKNDKFTKPPKEKDDLSMVQLKTDMTRLTRKLFSGAKELVQVQNAFFTPPSIASDMVEFSGINKTKHPIEFLEPTAGAGFIIYEALLSNKKIYCESIENIENLSKFVDTFPRTSSLPYSNFFNLPDTKKYRVILMNPPYTLQKGLGLKKRVSHDVDFVLRAFNDHLMEEGILIALITTKYEFRGKAGNRKADKAIFEPFRKLLEENDHKIIKYEDGFTKHQGAVLKEMETGTRLRMIKIIKKKK